MLFVTVSVPLLLLLTPAPDAKQKAPQPPVWLLMMLVLLSVSPPWLRMPPPPSASLVKPLVMVNPEMVASEAKFSHTRKVALPLTARFPAPGPLMVTLWLI